MHGRSPTTTSSGQDHRERLVADELLGHQHGVPEPELLLLAHVGDLGEVADVADLAEHLDVAPLLEQVLELVGEVEVVLDRPLLAAGDDDDLLDARRDRLLDGVLDDRLVDQRQHLLGLRLGGRQEAGPPAGGREDGFADAHRTSESVGLRGAASIPAGSRRAGRGVARCSSTAAGAKPAQRGRRGADRQSVPGTASGGGRAGRPGPARLVVTWSRTAAPRTSTPPGDLERADGLGEEHCRQDDADDGLEEREDARPGPADHPDPGQEERRRGPRRARRRR